MPLLYLTRQGTTLKKEQGRFLITPPHEETLNVPIREVEHILVFGTVHLTTPAIATCLTHHIPVVFLSQTGTYRGHLWSAEWDHFRAESAQHQRLGDDPFQWAIAQEIVRGKIWNCKQLLLKLNRRHNLDTVAIAIHALDRDLLLISHLTPPLPPPLPSSEDSLDMALAQLRGHEGAAAARYFPAMGQLIKNPDFSFTQRTRRPPTDPVNSLLSFGYTLLYNNVLSLLHVEGLNPYFGNLHRSDRHEPQLAFDLMEEWRSPIIDTLVMKLVNQRVFDAEDFQPPNASGGVYLTERSRRRFLEEFEHRIMSTVKHPDNQQSVPYRQAILLQIRRYKQALLKNVPYQAFRRAT